MKYSLEQRKARAMELRRQGYNCAQSVLMVFDDITGLDEATAARLASGLGAGVGASKELCGVPNAMAIAQGFQLPPTADAKPTAMRRAGELLRRFEETAGGKLRCADLKGHDHSIPCDTLILNGIEILHNFFEEQN